MIIYHIDDKCLVSISFRTRFILLELLDVLHLSNILLQYWGLDFRDQMNVARNYFGQYSTEVFIKKAQTIIAEHSTSEVNLLQG